MGLEADDDAVGVGDRADVVGGLGMRREVAARRERRERRARRMRLEVLPARDEHDVGAAPGEGRSDVGADRSGAEDAEAHAAYSP